MNKKIIVLNGAARKNGSTAKLVEAFSDGAESAGNQVRIFYQVEELRRGAGERKDQRSLSARSIHLSEERSKV